MAYHITKKGDAAKCFARTRCRLGSNEPHYESKDLARLAYEERMNDSQPQEASIFSDLSQQIPLESHHLRNFFGGKGSLEANGLTGEDLEDAYLTGLCHHLALHYHSANPERYKIQIVEFAEISSRQDDGTYHFYDGGHYFIHDTKEDVYLDIQGSFKTKESILEHSEFSSYMKNKNFVPDFWSPDTEEELNSSLSIYGGFHDRWQEDAAYAIKDLKLAEPESSS